MFRLNIDRRCSVLANSDATNALCTLLRKDGLPGTTRLLGAMLVSCMKYPQIGRTKGDFSMKILKQSNLALSFNDMEFND